MTTYILSGPQGVGKTRNKERIAAALQLSADDELITTNRDEVLPPGGVMFIVEDEAGLSALINLLERPANSTEHRECSNLVRLPYSVRSIPACAPEAKNLLSSSINESNWMACSGCALSPNTRHAASQAAGNVSATLATAPEIIDGASTDRSVLSIQSVSLLAASDSSI